VLAKDRLAAGLEVFLKILIVEDEQVVANVLSDYLIHAGFDTFCIRNGSDVLPWVRENKPGLILLDLMLPGRDGLEVCKEVRSFSTVPVIMVTARV
jgi:two-component system, OmpR family, response regulator BaeR